MAGLSLTVFLLTPGLLGAEKLEKVQKSTNAFFKGKTFTAKVDLKHQGKHDVDPDGQPTEGKKQGRHRRNRGMFVRDDSTPEGGVGKGIYVRVDESDREIKVVLSPKRGVTMHFSNIYIHFDRKMVEADVDPRAIARALAAYVDFEGVTVGSEISDALQQLTTDEPSVTRRSDVPPAQDPSPSLQTLRATSEPSSLRRGEAAEVLLKLTYSLSEATNTQPVPVTETRTLLFDDKPLPGYPVESLHSKGSGQHSTTYRQPIPSSAAPGRYEFQGTVCVDGDCITRTVTFAIE